MLFVYGFILFAVCRRHVMIFGDRTNAFNSVLFFGNVGCGPIKK